MVVTWLSNRFSATVHLDPFESNWSAGLTKLNCTVAVSPRTSTLHSSAISVYICVFPFLPPSTCLRFVCVPFCPRPPSSSSSSSSLPPSSLFFPSSTSTSQKKSFPTFLTHSSILYTCQSKAFFPLHLCSIGGCIAEHWDTSYMPIQFCTEHFEVCCHYDTVQLASYWTDECFLKLWKWTGHLVWFFWYCVLCGVLFLRVCSLSASPVRLHHGGGVPRPFWHRAHVLCWPDVNQPVPRLFSLAEYGSAGERSRRAKKRNIGRYTWYN